MGGISNPPPGQTPYVESFDRRAASASGVAFGTNQVYLCRIPRVAVPVPVSKMACFMVTAAGNVALGVYSSPDEVTFTLEMTTGPFAAAGAAVAQDAPVLTAGVLVPSKDYWLAIGSDGTPTVARVNGLAGLLTYKSHNGFKSAVYSAGLPATISAPLSASNIVMWTYAGQ